MHAMLITRLLWEPHMQDFEGLINIMQIFFKACLWFIPGVHELGETTTSNTFVLRQRQYKSKHLHEQTAIMRRAVVLEPTS